MSYILDALRKSERQRRLENIPSLASSEPRPPARDYTMHKWVVLAVALAVTMAVAGWWVMQRNPTPVEAGASAADRDRGSGAFAALGVQSLVANPPAARDPARIPPVESAPQTVAVDAATRPRHETPSSEVKEPPAGDDSPPGAAGPTPYARLDPELRAQLPSLTVNAVSFSEDAGRRFAMINEGIYREGQQIEGVTIAHVRREGVVLSYRGREFLLVP